MSPKKPTPDEVPGPEVQPTGQGGSYLIDPATGRPVAAPRPSPPSLPTPPLAVSPPQATPTADKETGK